MNTANTRLAYLILRFGTGVNLFMHGSTRLGSGFSAFEGYMNGLFNQSFLPSSLVEAMTFLIPVLETLLGVLLIFGVKTRIAITSAGALMVSLIFGMGLLQKWDVVGLQMNYLVIYFLLLFCLDSNYFSLDQYFTKSKGPVQ